MRQAPVPTGDSVDLVEISGSIKWFDVAKGYGFILPDGGKMGDVLLHVTCLRRDGFQTALEGSRVVCLVKRGDRGAQAFRVLSMDTSTAVHPAEMQEQRTHVSVAPESGLERALVKWFNRTKGFGFLTRGEGTEAAQVTDMCALLSEVASDARRGGADLVFECPGRMLIPVRPQAVKRCMTNIVDNAVRHGRHVRLHARRRRSAFDIMVGPDSANLRTAILNVAG